MHQVSEEMLPLTTSLWRIARYQNRAPIVTSGMTSNAHVRGRALILIKYVITRMIVVMVQMKIIAYSDTILTGDISFSGALFIHRGDLSNE